jgi:uncharacterized protein
LFSVDKDQSTFDLSIEDHTLRLMACGAALWVETQTLLVADLHLGKESTMQRNAIHAPIGASQATLQKLQDCLETTSAKRVIILGDLVHAKCSLSPSQSKMLKAMLDDHVSSEWILVEGNHDRGSRKQLLDYSLRCVGDVFSEGPFEFIHDPQLDSNVTLTNDASERASKLLAGSKFTIAGHLHPAIRMRDNREKIRCFYQTPQVLVLPAFGSFTGTKAMPYVKGDAAYLIDQSRIFKATLW